MLLHEGLGSLGLWRDFPTQLAEATGCCVFAWSRLGYGQSDPKPPPWPVTYMHDEAALLPAVLLAADIGPHVLVGHSDGGSIATIHAGSPGKPAPRGLVLLAPHFVVEDATLAGIRAARDRFAAGPLRDRLSRHHRDAVATFRGWNDAWLDPTFADWSIVPELARVTAPMLLVQGLADPYGTALQAELAQLHSAGPVETVLLPGVGHAPHAEAPAAVLAAIAGFCNRVWESAG